MENLFPDVSDFIDLSEPFILADHRGLSSAVIEIDTDDSLIELNDSDCVVGLARQHNNSTLNKTRHNILKPRKNNQVGDHSPTQSTHKIEKTELSKKNVTKLIKKAMQSQLGECPICYEICGKNPLASTMCGHVYCMKCLERYLSIDKRCPTCRKPLKGKSSYHPLYLNN